jgi:FkbM family methyltransferase
MQAPLTFDHATGQLAGASAIERFAVLLLQAGALASSPMGHRGFSIGAKAVSSLIDRREIVIKLNDDARFSFPLGDGYWSLLLDRNFHYEAEIENFLLGVADVDFAFIDGGANFGLWSVLASSKPYGSHKAIAIEASSANAARLTRNAELNGNRFVILHRAIGPTSGGHAWLTGHKHEALHLDMAAGSNGNGQTQGESVEIMALDSLLEQGLVSPNRRHVIKLDVEGMEIEAIKGSKRLFSSEIVFIAEEHGSDRSHTVSRYIMSDTPCRVFVLDPTTGRYEPLTDLSMLDRIKSNRAVGYNVFATNSPFWEERIKSVPVTRH